jgi:hypothetical protein
MPGLEHQRAKTWIPLRSIQSTSLALLGFALAQPNRRVLFPAAMVAFLLVGVWALILLGDFYGRVLTRGGFDCARNNSFA